MFNVIMLAREYGSRAGAIARTVAEKLGWIRLDRESIGAFAPAVQVDAETVGRYDEDVDWWCRFNRGRLRRAAIVSRIPPGDAQFSQKHWPRLRGRSC
jgi:hypothetical protein